MRQKSKYHVYELEGGDHLRAYRIQPGFRLPDLIRKNIEKGGIPLGHDTLERLANDLVIVHSVSDLRSIEDKIHIKDGSKTKTLIVHPVHLREV